MPKFDPEPWLSGSHSDIAAVPRAVIHAIELAEEDLALWCGGLTDQELGATPFALPSIAFQLRHIARSLDRLLTYAEGRQLNDQQLESLKTESIPDFSRPGLFNELSTALTQSPGRLRKFSINPAALQEPRMVGRKNLPTTVAGLLVHVADHTQRHVGQAITTAKILLAQRAC